MQASNLDIACLHLRGTEPCAMWRPPLLPVQLSTSSTAASEGIPGDAGMPLYHGWHVGKGRRPLYLLRDTPLLSCTGQLQLPGFDRPSAWCPMTSDTNDHKRAMSTLQKRLPHNTWRSRGCFRTQSSKAAILRAQETGILYRDGY